MSLFLIYRESESDRQTNGVHAMIVDAADESSARARTGECAG